VAVKPLLQALWLADDVDCNPKTGKVTLVGIFDQIEVTRPATHFASTAYLFCALRGIHGRTELVLCYVDLSSNAVLLEWPVSLNETNPLATVDIAFRLPPVPVPHEGEYAWELYFEGEVIGSSRVTATVIQQGEHQD
jgi:hypothetical protein